MENEIVVGVGNIYASESLFDAGISPLRQSSSLTKKEIEKLISSIKKTIKAAIKSGGSSISDYVDSNGNHGQFQNNFRVYGRAGGKLGGNCLQCKNPIQRIVQSGRASFFCNQCQK
jgi:formamidopyrimidine-DNA glycosylase